MSSHTEDSGAPRASVLKWTLIMRDAYAPGHVVKTWAQTQSVFALLSGEAEYYGMVKGASYFLGIRSLASDLGMEWGQPAIEIFTDSSAARGIAIRRGLGKVRHIAVCQLWLQDKVNEGEIRVSKMKGTDNQSDILTKHVTASTLERHLESMSRHVVEHRPEMMPTTVGI